MRPWNNAAPLLTALAALVPLVAATHMGLSDQDTKKRPKPPKGAKHLVHMENWVRRVKIETMESAPPQFAVVLTVSMPTPLWKLKVDKVARPDADGRIKVSITGTRPAGLLPQVVTDAKIRVPLGRLPKGRYLLEVYGRDDAKKPHQRQGVTLVHAFDKWGE
ncbi:MAG: hypothetical protein ACYTGW_09900 [Planctomycetota bacterium]|jgi:hypothetical protein